MTSASLFPDTYRRLYTIRRFEETVLDNFPKGVFFGTTHTYLGEEANAVGVLAHLVEGDIVFSNHRCHGHFLTYARAVQPLELLPQALRALFAELMGKATGVCSGRGGSQHLQWKNFYSNGVQGGIAPVGTGMALAEKLKSSRSVAVVFIGDGTLGEGAVYEALNLASLWNIPVLYVVENNRIAQTTSTELGIAGDIPARFQAFGIPARELDTSDVLEILPVAGDLLAEVRAQQRPRALILHTCRFGPHSKGDDTRPAEIVAQLRQQRDPLAIHAIRLEPSQRTAIESEVDAAVAQAFQQALADPYPTLEIHSPAAPHTTALPDLQPPRPQPTVLEMLNAALRQAMQTNPQVYLLGEDLLDPYGGAFKVTRGLSQTFPGRVLTTPISEAGFTGLAIGMALRGLRPVVEIMFGDFVTLIADQLINHAAKFRWMYAGDLPDHDPVRVPLVVRTPMGGRRGYGPTHSQTLEKLFLGAPGLRVLAPCALGDPGKLLLNTILTSEDPTLFVENKLLYLLPVLSPATLDEFDVAIHPRSSAAPTYTLTLRGAPPAHLTLAAYGYMAELARQAAVRLAYEHEVFVELVIPTQLAPFDLEAVFVSTERTRRLVTVEEGAFSLGWGAEALAQTAERLSNHLLAANRLAALDLPIPSSGPLEEVVLPSIEKIIAVCLQAVQKNQAR